MGVLSPFISVILIDFSTESPVHVLMLSIQAVRGLPRSRAPGIVPSIAALGAKSVIIRQRCCLSICSAATRALRWAGLAVRAASAAASSAVSRAAAPDACGRPTSTVAGTSTRAGTATAPDDDGMSSCRCLALPSSAQLRARMCSTTTPSRPRPRARPREL